MNPEEIPLITGNKPQLGEWDIEKALECNINPKKDPKYLYSVMPIYASRGKKNSKITQKKR